jgi:hypothetical protein
MAVATTPLPAIEALYKFIMLVQNQHTVPTDIQVFVQFIKRLATDYRYAVVCRESNLKQIRLMQPQHGMWIASTINSAKAVLVALESLIPSFLKEINPEDAPPSFGDDHRLPESIVTKDTIKKVFRAFKYLQKHDTALVACHTSLMSVIASLQSIELAAGALAPQTYDSPEHAKPLRRMAAWGPPRQPAEQSGTEQSGAARVDQPDD